MALSKSKLQKQIDRVDVHQIGVKCKGKYSKMSQESLTEGEGSVQLTSLY
jgi:hypothetical protein